MMTKKMLMTGKIVMIAMTMTKEGDSDYDEKMTMTMMIGVLGLAAPPSDPLSSP